jgi:hypothetical protein
MPICDHDALLLAFTMKRQKRHQVAFGNPDDTADPVRDEIARPDPPPDRTGGDVETLRHFGDREKFLIVAITAPTQMAESTLFHAGGPSSKGHAAHHHPALVV